MSKKQTPEEIRIAAKKTSEQLSALFGPAPAATATAAPVPAAMATAARPAQPKRVGVHTLADLSNGNLGGGMSAATASGTMTVVVPPPAAAAPQPAPQPSGFDFSALGECLGGMNRQVENLAGRVDQDHRELARQGRAIAALQAQQRGGRGRGRGARGGRSGSFRPMGAQPCFGGTRCTDIREGNPLGTTCHFNHDHLTDAFAPALSSPPPSASSDESKD